MKIRAFITHKEKERITDCQDRFAVNKDTKRVAISDGISQSIFPDYWAELLVNHYCQSGTLDENGRKKLCDKWKEHVEKYIEDEKAKGNNPWRTEYSLSEGYSAGATLCGVQFNDPNTWECKVIGDSCLIKIDTHNHNNYNFELLSSEEKEFDNEPDYIDSNPQKKGRGDFKEYSGAISESNKLILVSDPFSDFFYKNKQNAQKLIQEMLDINSHEDFTSLVKDWRLQGMKGDDSTIIIVEWDNSLEFNILHKDDIEDMIKSGSQNQTLPIEAKGQDSPQAPINNTSSGNSTSNEECKRTNKQSVQSAPEVKDTQHIQDFVDKCIKCELNNECIESFIKTFKTERKKQKLREFMESLLYEFVTKNTK